MTLNPAKDPSCVLAFDWGEESGNTAYDLSGKGNNGTIHGATRTRGILGHAIHCDGVNDYVKVPDSDSLDLTEETGFTIMAWVKYINKNNGDFNCLVLKNMAYLLYIPGSHNKFAFYLRDAVTNKWDTWLYYYLVQNDKWYFFVGTYDGTTRRLYVDGEEIASYEKSVEVQTSTYDVFIGYTTTLYPLKGLIGSMRLYNRALSKKEILEHYYYGIKIFAQKIPSKYVPSPLKI